jgi:hypothetical protein
MIPTVDRRDVRALTTDQMREVDRAMIEDFHIELIQMMENAGRSLDELALARFAPVAVTMLASPAATAGAGRGAAPGQPRPHCLSGPIRTRFPDPDAGPPSRHPRPHGRGDGRGSALGRPGRRRPDRLQLARRSNRTSC